MPMQLYFFLFFCVVVVVGITGEHAVKLHPNRNVFSKFPIKAYAFGARTSVEIDFCENG